MRYAIISDVHSNQEALEAVLKALKAEGVDALFCTGDIVGYASNPGECISALRDVDCTCVCGNHDLAAAGVFDYSYFSPYAIAAVEWTSAILKSEEKDYLRNLPLIHKEKLFTMVHGSLYEPERFHYVFTQEEAEEALKECKTGFCFIGHSHRPFIYSTGRKTVVNVGSVGQPRDGDPRAHYCIFDTEKRTAEVKRVAYDVDTAMRKIREAGLPEFLAARLKDGR